MLQSPPTKGHTALNWLAGLSVLAAVLFSFHAQLPSADAYQNGEASSFSQQNALQHLARISTEPHYLGSEGHQRVQDYLFDELTSLGLEVERFTRTGTHFGRQFAAAPTTNLVARIQGKQPGNALALVTHYDSSLHSSHGASDAGSGVVTILEGVRAFLARDKQPDNDILILLTDGEERGLLGAEAFVRYHPWAAQIKLVLNFEARGSGGSSYMLLESNGGNAKLIQAFAEAGLAHPAGNSLMYSIYKMLPNDTDLTVFREKADIPGFNFAFIDDHFDYHTRQDIAERLDRASLNHQAEYLTTLLDHFAGADLNALKADTDLVYFNFPVLGMVVYPFDWGPVLVLLAGLWLLWRLRQDWRAQILTGRNVLVGSTAIIASLVIAVAIGLGGWHLLLWLYPPSAEISHGFSYNGHWLMAGMLALTAAATFGIYRLASRNNSLCPLYPLPLLIWLGLGIALTFYLPGAGFLVLPLLIILLGLGLVSLARSGPAWLNGLASILAFLLALLPIMLLAPLIPAFVIGLGLKAMVVGTVLLVLLMALVLPLYSSNRFASLGMKTSLLLALVTLTVALVQSDYNESQKKPNSINYLVDHDSGQAYWLSANRRIDEFVGQFLTAPRSGEQWQQSLYPNHRSSRVRWFQPTPALPLEAAEITVIRDDRIGTERNIALRIQPRRPAALLQLATKTPLTISRMAVDGQVFQQGQGQIAGGHFERGFFFTYTQADPMAPLNLSFTVPVVAELDLQLFETAYDLYELFDLALPRPPSQMPEPFIINDAVIIGQSLAL